MRSVKKKITLILSFHEKAVQYEWLVDSIDKTRFELSFVFLNPADTFIEKFMRSKDILTYRVTYRSKKDIPEALFKVWQILRKIKPDAVHCNLFDANIIGLTAAKLAGIKKRIYTRHHSSFHHKYFPAAVKWDKYCNFLATRVVAISRNVYNVLTQRENLSPRKIILIHHGFKLNELAVVEKDRIDIVKSKYNYKNEYPVIGVVSRYIPWKGIQYIIEGFKKFIDVVPSAKLVLANASGYFSNEIKAALKELPADSFREIVFENDSPALYKTFDYLVHVPIDAEFEAFGQVYIEAMAAGVPSVVTLSGVAPEFIENKKNAMVVNYCNGDEIYEALLFYHHHPEIKQNIIDNATKDVFKNFEFHLFLKKLENLYSE
jgi:glycosyltransferase involved in cell wall biosynthesis